MPDIETALTWTPRPDLRLQAGPSPLEITVRPSVRLEIERGRVAFQGELVCQAANVPVSEVEVQIPPLLQVVSIEADRLSDWSRPARDRLRLRFETLDTSDRTIRVSGWIAVSSDPLAPEARYRELPVPWLSISGATEEAGTLVIQAPPGVRPTLRESSGLTASPGSAPLVGLTDRLIFRTAGPARGADRVERGWVAGECERVQPSVIPSWAGGLDVSGAISVPGRTDEVDPDDVAGGLGSRLQVETLQGEADAEVSMDGALATLDLTMDRPIWGERELVIRAHRPFDGRRIPFPDLVPLGNGQVKTSIAWTDLSGWSLVAEGSAGIQPVDPSRFPRTGLPVPSTSDLSVYQVLRSGWSLAIQAPGGQVPEGGDPDSRSVSFADVECVLGSDGWITGRCRFLVEAGNSPFLTLEMPSGAPAVVGAGGWATSWTLEVAGGAIADPSGRNGCAGGAVAVGSAGERDGIPWGSDADVGSDASGSDGVCPSEYRVNPPGLLRREIGLAVEVERFERASLRVIQGLSRFDRSSVRDRSQLLASLVELELRIRSALRLAQGPMGRQERWPRELQSALLDRVSQAQGTLGETLRAAGLEDYLATARNRVGLEPADPLSDRSEIAEPPTEFRLLRLGRPSWFRGTIDAREGAVVLEVGRGSTGEAGFEVGPILVGLGVLIGSGVLTLLSAPGRPLRLLIGVIFAIAATVPMEIDLAGYGVLLGLVALGALVRAPGRRVSEGGDISPGTSRSSVAGG